MRWFARKLLGLTCLAGAALAMMLLYPAQVRVLEGGNVFVIWHDHVIGDALAHFLRIATPLGSLMLCATSLALFWCRNARAP